MSESTEVAGVRRPERYEPGPIERKWQAYWEKNGTFATPAAGDPRPKLYVLDMFPYPSGAGLHVGHPEGYTATDIVARFKRANGFAVLHPMGWDAFGLPAEQYAIQTNTHPAVTTAKNIETFRRQLKMLGFSYDWEREVDTTDPAYVRWTQWIFLKLFHRGLAYQAETPVNWCAALGTVLANEEVKDGLSERGGHPVEQMPLRQWILAITKYQDRLLEDLSILDWPEGVRAMQRDWIGRSEGAEVRFPVDGVEGAVIEVFTTRPDTLYGATFMVLAPEHVLVDRITTPAQRGEVDRYIAETRAKSERDRTKAKEKTGVFTGAHVVHPLTGAKVPVWIADYVLATYGTGAIMAVPAHDERDFAFARRFGIPVVEVVSPKGVATEGELAEPFVEDGIAVRSGPYDGLSTADFKRKITKDLEAAGKGNGRVQHKLRDWVFARQRYWGEPIPIYFPVETDGDPRKGDAHVIRYDQPIAVQESELPVRLPELEDFQPTGDPDGPLVKAVDWRFFQKDGRWFAREINTMPQWAGSCWYYLRFMDPKNANAAWSPEAAKRWLPVDLYVGGAEHAVLHLLYARFWHKVLYDEGLVPCVEPFTKLVNQGMILGEIELGYDIQQDGEKVEIKVSEDDVEKRGDKLVLKSDPAVVVTSRAHKMSKSRGNVVNPDEIVARFGVDSLRLYEMFMGPLEATKPWSTASIQGVRRFLERVFHVAQRERSAEAPDETLSRLVHKTIRKVTADIEGLRFNTAISALMILANDLAERTPVPEHAVETLAVLLHPFAPHLAEEVWAMLGHAPSIQAVAWPTFDPALCEDAEIEIPVQVNGKVRGKVKVPADASEAVVLGRARAVVAAHVEGKSIAKEVYVSGRIVTIVAK